MTHRDTAAINIDTGRGTGARPVTASGPVSALVDEVEDGSIIEWHPQDPPPEPTPTAGQFAGRVGLDRWGVVDVETTAVKLLFGLKSPAAAEQADLAAFLDANREGGRRRVERGRNGQSWPARCPGRDRHDRVKAARAPNAYIPPAPPAPVFDDPWPEEPDDPFGDPGAAEERFDLDIPDAEAASPELQRAFWSLVAVFNIGLFAVSLGALLVGFRGQWNLGGSLLAAGAVLLAYGVWQYRRYRVRGFGANGT